MKAIIANVSEVGVSEGNLNCTASGAALTLEQVHSFCVLTIFLKHTAYHPLVVKADLIITCNKLEIGYNDPEVVMVVNE